MQPDRTVCSLNLRIPGSPSDAESTRFKINQRVMSNTVEQTLIFVPMFLALSIRMRPEDVWAMATTAGAAALGLEGRAGVLTPGAWADLAVLDGGAREAQTESLTHGEPEVSETWVAGRPARV